MGFAENGDDVLDGDDEEAVVAFEVDGDGALGVEEDFVVLFDGVLFVFFDFGGDGDDAAGEGGDLDFVGQVDAGLRLLLVFVFADEDAGADGFDDFQGGRLLGGGCWSCCGHFSGVRWGWAGRGDRLPGGWALALMNPGRYSCLTPF